MITTVGSEEKADIARKLGADHVILYRHEDVAARVRAITGGLGVPVGYDSVGKDTFEATLASLSVRGMFVSYGNAAGAVEPFSPQRLAAGGSLFFARPRLGDYIATPEELDLSAGRLWAVLRDGTVKIDIAQTFALEDARAAHEALEGRRTVGASLLIP